MPRLMCPHCSEPWPSTILLVDLQTTLRRTAGGTPWGAGGCNEPAPVPEHRLEVDLGGVRIVIGPPRRGPRGRKAGVRECLAGRRQFMLLTRPGRRFVLTAKRTPN